MKIYFTPFLAMVRYLSRFWPWCAAAVAAAAADMAAAAAAAALTPSWGR